MISMWGNHISKYGDNTNRKKGNKQVPAGLYVLNTPFIIIKRKTTIYLKSTLAKNLKI